MQMNRLTVSVIVPAYNAEAVLPDCLQALQQQTAPPDEIIVADDGSSDRTAQVAREMGVKVLSHARQGPAAARNLGAEGACGDILLFTDADCAPAPEWVATLSQPFRNPHVVGAKGTYRTRQKSLVSRFVQQEYEYKYERLARRQFIDFIDTYSAAYRREVFLDNGGFDAAFTAPSVEDQEFSFRLARKGYALVFTPAAAVYHQHDANVGEYVRRKFGIGYWKAYMLRWLPEKALGDSHTPPSQQWQILLLALVMAALVVGVAWPPIWPPAWGLALIGLLAFYFTAAPFLVQVWLRDRPVIPIAPLVLMCRALALGAGLLVGFVLPPSKRQHPAGGLSLWTRPVKRLIDIIGALVGGIVSLPFIVAAAIAIRFDSRGPAFFAQVRCGENGKPFRMLKLRTMVDGADTQLSYVLERNVLNGPAFKLPGDPRVTRVGRFLRRWSIDELPQFWNVLKGEMSLVGPRPEELRFVEHYDERQRRRLVVKPGLTGPAQVAGRGALDFEVRLQVELDYIMHYSLAQDVKILWRSIDAVISGRGAY